jgi:translation initiation factor 5
MAALMNIAGNTPVNDPAYRYKMPRIQGKVEGRGNGIKTVLLNINDVALSLKRDAPEITKFFGCELGSQTSYGADDRAIVNGAHRDADLQNHLTKYIENFVLCKNCRLPETHYKIKDGIISQKCLACGAKDPVDMTHKLTTFILAQYKKHKEQKKKEEKEAAKAGGGGDKEEKKEKKEKKDKKSKEAEEAENSGELKKSKSKSKSSSSNLAGENGHGVDHCESSSPTNAGAAGETVFGFAKEAEPVIEDESDAKVAGKCEKPNCECYICSFTKNEK